MRFKSKIFLVINPLLLILQENSVELNRSWRVWRSVDTGSRRPTSGAGHKQSLAGRLLHYVGQRCARVGFLQFLACVFMLPAGGYEPSPGKVGAQRRNSRNRSQRPYERGRHNSQAPASQVTAYVAFGF